MKIFAPNKVYIGSNRSEFRSSKKQHDTKRLDFYKHYRSNVHFDYNNCFVFFFNSIWLSRLAIFVFFRFSLHSKTNNFKCILFSCNIHGHFKTLRLSFDPYLRVPYMLATLSHVELGNRAMDCKMNFIMWHYRLLYMVFISYLIDTRDNVMHW